MESLIKKSKDEINEFEKYFQNNSVHRLCETCIHVDSSIKHCSGELSKTICYIYLTERNKYFKNK